MDIYLPIAGLSVNVLVIILLGGAVGMLSGCSASAVFPYHAAAYLLRHSANGCGGFCLDTGDRGQRIGRVAHLRRGASIATW